MHQTKTPPHPQAQGQARSTRRHSLQTALALALAASLAPVAAWADAYPSKPITLVVPFGAGSQASTNAAPTAAAAARRDAAARARGLDAPSAASRIALFSA